MLDFAHTRDLSSEVRGTLTSTPSPGAVIGRGEVLFSVNNQGVFLFDGALPAWRPFESGMDNGPDIQQLENTLRAAGHFDAEPDQKFTWSTVEAIYSWQKATGQPETGRIEFGRVVFTESSIRVAEVLAPVGSHVGAGVPVLSISALEQAVTADVKLADQRLAVVDVTVDVQLPGGVTTAGVITSVGQPTEREANGSTTVVIPVAITLVNAEDAVGIQKANVTVNVPSETREGVLSVPLESLIALPGGDFGVEIIDADGDTDQVPVTTGLFAGGRVEISGPKIAAGVNVVVPST
ncbi:peptidoglycan hydrolase-like protein with peptidoglycan-binding domain [Microbacterium phyllosphaerae]|uniref:Peptidoglycan hydrolase-like protein with peptidoglycan-binding domain n=1 Tax=Microbacterium phyllosphaerae TaxID=124798 RepID=A0ABS4WL27_9MICO|nr:peptidoglycan-binding protein [Microbacterium phyllosphaerae]MBP2376897.1 peptidoglycan hydrolase-like protein with peptidoglycan-binding domain [Microbacterium phyllosphaerae]